MKRETRPRGLRNLVHAIGNTHEPLPTDPAAQAEREATIMQRDAAARHAIFDAADYFLRIHDVPAAQSALRCAWELSMRAYYVRKGGPVRTAKNPDILPAALRAVDLIDRETFERLAVVPNQIKSGNWLDLCTAFDRIGELAPWQVVNRAMPRSAG